MIIDGPLYISKDHIFPNKIVFISLKIVLLLACTTRIEFSMVISIRCQKEICGTKEENGFVISVKHRI